MVQCGGTADVCRPQLNIQPSRGHVSDNSASVFTTSTSGLSALSPAVYQPAGRNKSCAEQHRAEFSERLCGDHRASQQFDPGRESEQCWIERTSDAPDAGRP